MRAAILTMLFLASCGPVRAFPELEGRDIAMAMEDATDGRSDALAEASRDGGRYDAPVQGYDAGTIGSPVGCDGGQIRCENACVDSMRDPANCGGCNGVCWLGPSVSGTTCWQARCRIATCSPGTFDCNGTYTDGCESREPCG